ncbi:MAG: response regulator [Myxococcales bacterium]|nr:response regulator [Myxococcales bacterium]
MKILVVDDSKAMRAIVHRALRQAGFANLEVLEASNGKEGLDRAKSDQPELIISDWNMPEMTGIEFLKALRGDGVEIPFGFVTSLGTPAMQAEAVSAGASFFITKPFRPETFEVVLGPYL